MNEIKKRGKRGELIWDELIPWIIGAIVLALFIFVYIILSGKGHEYIDYIKNVLRIR